MIKPFAWLRAALFSKTELPPVAAVEKAKVEPIAMEITVDTSDLKAALALLEQIAEEAKKANAALEVMRACGAPVLAR